MSRLISTEMQAVAQAEVVRPFYLIDMEFSTPLRLWTGLGDLDVPTGDTLVINGDFSGGFTGWTTIELGTGTVTLVGDSVELQAGNFSNRAGLRQNIPTVSGTNYRLNFSTTGRARVIIRDMVNSNNLVNLNVEAGQGAVSFTAASTNTRVEIRNQEAGTITIDNVAVYYTQTYVGLGDLLKIGQIREATDLSANGTTVTLTGVKSSLIAVARDEDYQGKIATIKLGAMDELSNVITNPVQLFSGFMDVMIISDSGESSTINVSIENKLIAFDRAYVRRFTDGDQKIDYPSDKGFEFVTSIQELEIIWGRPSPRDS
tara:strand:+ start:4890 stop:5837 length:948 start_codon:yes stop_codon:yes gene_type:complete